MSFPRRANWTSDPFRLRAEGDQLFGRAASDMKGFLAAALAALPAMAKMPLSRPIHFAFSYDEEAGCRGVPHMIARIGNLCAPPVGRNHWRAKRHGGDPRPQGKGRRPHRDPRRGRPFLAP